MAALFYLTGFLFSLGQAGRLSFFNQQINFYLYEVFLSVQLLLLIFKYRLGPSKKALKNYPLAFLFFVFAFVSLLVDIGKYSLYENFVGFLYLLRLLLYGMYFIYLSKELFGHIKLKKVIQKNIFMMSVMIVGGALIQYFLYPDLRNLQYLGWDPHLGRTFGVFLDTSTAAAIFGIIGLYSTNYLTRLVFAILLLFSFSRGGYISFFFGLIYAALRHQKIKQVFFLIIIFIAIAITVPKPFGEGSKINRSFTITARIKDYKEGISLFVKKPFLGFGYNRLRFVRNKAPDDHSSSTFSSSYLTILISTGLLGLSTFLYALLYLWRDFRNARPILAFLFLFSIFDNVILHPFILYLSINLLFDT